jgi:hypothetical protein
MMAKFSIRILYRDRNNPGKFVGVLEKQGEETKRGFVSMEELWKILDSYEPESDRGNVVFLESKRRRPREELIDLFRKLREE